MSLRDLSLSWKLCVSLAFFVGLFEVLAESWLRDGMILELWPALLITIVPLTAVCWLLIKRPAWLKDWDARCRARASPRDPAVPSFAGTASLEGLLKE